jgi:glutamate N-acetyltransferase/amino-acid N-acetyltransferase
MHEDAIPHDFDTVNGLKFGGIKEGKNGLGVVLCSGNIAGVFTKNKIKSAPVILTSEHIKNGKVKGIVVNSGNANAYTGEEGLRNAERMAELLADRIGCKKEEVAVCSTGVIGYQLEMNWIEKKIDEVFRNLSSSKSAVIDFAKSIMTTDSFPKVCSVKVDSAVICGIAKGAGMIAPDMATMLAFIFTDAYFDSETLQSILREAVDVSFNTAIVDGDTSTNDTVLLISCGNKVVDRSKFQKALNEVCFKLAKMIVRDGEGATKVFEVHVINARDNESAFKGAKTIARSILVKTAIFGCDANWGRIISAIGYSGIEVTDNISIWFEARKERVTVLKNGKRTGNEPLASKLMRKNDDFKIFVDLHMGNGKGHAIGCDLTYDYVKLNAEYTT